MQLLDAPPAAAPTSQIRWFALPFPLLSAWLLTGFLIAIPSFFWLLTIPEAERSVGAAIPVAATLLAAALATPALITDVSVTLMPWGFTLLIIGAFWLAGRSIARILDGAQWAVTGAVVLGGGVLTGIVGAIAGRWATIADVSFHPLQVGAFAFAMSTIGLTAGALARGELARYLRGIPIPHSINVARGVGVAVFALLAMGSLLLLISFLRNLTTAQQVFDNLRLATGEAFVLTGLQIGYLPVLLVWAIAYLTGAGVLLGPDAVVSPFVATAAPIDVPPLPILAVVPTSSPPTAWIFPVLVVLVGAIAAHVALRHTAADTARLHRLVIVTVMAVLTCGVIMFLAVLSTGSLGVERLASLGPTPTVLGWVTGGLLLIGALPMALIRPVRRPVA
jgi:hypothetical protein